MSIRVNELPPGITPVQGAMLEAIVVQTTGGAAPVLGAALPGGPWSVVPVEGDTTGAFFDALPARLLGVKEAWDVVHGLRALPTVLSAEPSWYAETIYQVMSERGRSARSVGLEASSAARSKTWALDLVSIRRAWDVPLPPGGKSRGEGIRVAHPDSGYTRHPELIESPTTLDIASGFDFVAGDADALDDAGFHGTATASVLASTEAGDLMGAAPRAVLVPMRVAQQGFLRPEPVLLGSGTVRLRKAIRLAIERGCHVISISLGWLGNRALHDAVREASAADIIIVAAAGNYTGPFVVWPGRYAEVICMSGCDADRSIWGGSAFGTGVDFSAPAEDVWNAGFDGREAVVETSSGTSFATALTAGVAALWLAHHGRQALLERYAPSGVRLTEVFRKVLAASAQGVPSGGALGWGPIIDAERALSTPLPPVDDVRALRSLNALNVPPPEPGTGATLPEALQVLGRPEPEGKALLARTYGVSEGDLERLPNAMGDELAFHALLADSARPERAVRVEAFASPRVSRVQLSEKLSAQLRV